MRWTAYYLVTCISSWSFMCADKSYWKESETQSVNEASQLFFMLVLALLVSLASKMQPTAAWIAFSIQSVLASLACEST